ncbi:DNA topoisomerase IB [Aeromicrobium sp. 636]|uniref:DNA topoisomerase n=1 Tax=Aeromicrobium senzhongii TaxID=2663859 RepID=A0A8I0EWR9_9ACTN|nr:MULTISPECIES: DNA topoisomerase IB [Aeromicrobium]MBC9226751.1 DNA topoisomerase IB [Aeromicrobium senzhongii]MCQ3998851.1 DNA topoisomerase IB [Aeromicrobium sp. 636]MTB89276.1 DNA topoisomerase IB [Aeromicrobium senzhongii]QNL93462.1 DNA topoisomerase IB [Aeromicrobium senzhongii]
MRLRRVTTRTRGWTRRRAGRGWTYLDEDGTVITGEDRERIEALVIPPAWQDVWISPWPNGHLQATGVDQAGRTQYLYHPDWVHRRNLEKFDRISQIAAELPKLRALVGDHITAHDGSREHAAAVAVRMLDSGSFRVGNDVYARQGSFGLTTLERRHVRAKGSTLVFTFVGKSGVEHNVVLEDEPVVDAINRMRRRRGGGPRLLEYLANRSRYSLDSSDVNTYLREQTGLEISAKDLRTWAGTVLAAEVLALSDEPGETNASRARAVRSAMTEVSLALGNTPTVVRSSYVDPRLISLYESGTVIPRQSFEDAVDPLERRHAIERETLRLLRQAD